MDVGKGCGHYGLLSSRGISTSLCKSRSGSFIPARAEGGQTGRNKFRPTIALLQIRRQVTGIGCFWRKRWRHGCRRRAHWTCLGCFPEETANSSDELNQYSTHPGPQQFVHLFGIGLALAALHHLSHEETQHFWLLFRCGISIVLHLVCIGCEDLVHNFLDGA